MVTHVLFHIEGGRNKTQDIEMRRAFNQFFNEIYQSGNDSNIKVTFMLHGSRRNAYEKFCFALIKNPEVYNVLLVDSEDPVQEFGKCWQHLKDRPDDRWDRPDNVNDDQCQLMCQAIEAWFFADPDGLKSYYGQHFHIGALSRTSNVENIAKRTQINNLETATRGTTKGRYHKYDHLPGILMTIDPLKVKNRAPHCARIFDTLLNRIKSNKWS
jgi:hypothetical protein